MTITNIFEYKNTHNSVETIDQTPQNISDVLECLSNLTYLNGNWDSYGASPPSKQALLGSVHIAYQLLRNDTPTPDVFPVPNGNIQFEWSCFNLDIEIEIESPGKCHVCFENLENPENDWEETLTFDLTKLSNVISELTHRSQDAQRLRMVN